MCRDFGRTWPQLAVTDLLAKVAGVIVLTPVFALLARVFVGTGASGLLTDEEILHFFLHPTGVAFLVLTGGVWAGVMFAELAALMTIGLGAREDRRVSYLAALSYAARRAPALARLAGRLIAVGLAAAAPFLALGGGAGVLLLSEHDINYYLSATPREFWIAAAVAGASGVALAGLLLWLAVRWCLALPMVLFERKSPREALRRSAEATLGHRRAIALWFLSWGAAAFLVSSLAAGLVGVLDRWLIPTESSSLAWVSVAIGASLLVLALFNGVVTLVSNGMLALLLVRIYGARAVPGELAGARFGARGSLGERAVLSVPRKGVIAASLTALAIAGAGLLGLLHSIRDVTPVAVAAHRGGAALAPENSLAAIERAIAAGAEWVEIDVQETRDGVVMVLHDQDFLRVGGAATKLWQAERALVETIDIGSSFAAEFADQRAPTLAQVLATCKGRTGVIIELKYYGHDQRLEERVIELVEAAGMTDSVQIMSLAAAGLRKTRALRPGWTYGLLVAVAMGDLARADFDFLAVREPLATRALIRHAHGRGKRIYAWTVDDAVQMSALISRGVDVLITDRPARARSVIAQHAELSPVQRLLLAAGVRFGLLDDEEEPTPLDDA